MAKAKVKLTDEHKFRVACDLSDITIDGDVMDYGIEKRATINYKHPAQLIDLGHYLSAKSLAAPEDKTKTEASK